MYILYFQHFSIQTHVKCSVATCGSWLPYWAALGIGYSGYWGSQMSKVWSPGFKEQRMTTWILPTKCSKKRETEVEQELDTHEGQLI